MARPPHRRGAPTDEPGRDESVIVIGAGLAGLAAACHLTGRGYEVTVVEREIGARRPHRAAAPATGFTFDTGPTVLTMPDLIADALRAVGRRPVGARR